MGVSIKGGCGWDEADNEIKGGADIKIKRGLGDKTRIR